MAMSSAALVFTMLRRDVLDHSNDLAQNLPTCAADSHHESIGPVLLFGSVLSNIKANNYIFFFFAECTPTN